MRTLTVQGVGRGSFAPDRIEITFTITALDPDYEKGALELDRRYGELGAALLPVGFDREEIKTTSYDVHAEYRSVRTGDGDYKQVFSGYRFTHRLMLRFDMEAARLSAALSAVAGSLPEPELNVSFTLKDRRSALDALLTDAVRNAFSQAQTLARAAGQTLGELLSIDAAPGAHAFVSPAVLTRDAGAAKMCLNAMGQFSPQDVEEEERVTCVWALQ